MGFPHSPLPAEAVRWTGEQCVPCGRFGLRHAGQGRYRPRCPHAVR